ncbi:phospholipid-transporting ATPase ABCA3-like [Euwallacea fornicatus]|uniref:phospholipid-transporting ATPase ABCA3-like n=1 Tax=Euwallacea fornicatus TaxID=995702 RepID=UPI00338EB549
MAQMWNKFLLLMWKNWVHQYRKPIQTVIEIFIPVLFSILLVLLRSQNDPKPHDPVEYEPFCTLNDAPCDGSILSLLNNSRSVFSNYTLYYSPKSPATQKVMSPFAQIFAEVEPFSTASEMEYVYKVNNTKSNVFAGIQFKDSLADKGELDPNVEVTLRFPAELRGIDGSSMSFNWLTNLIFPLQQTAGPREAYDRYGGTPEYYRQRFLALQHLVSVFISMDKIDVPSIDDTKGWENVLNNNPMPLIKMVRFPYAAWIRDELLTALQSFVGLIFMMSFVYTCINVVKAITAEKENQLKETMKIMGLPNWLHWTAWFLKSLIFILISIILMVIFLKVKWYTRTDYTVFTHANPFVLLIFLFIYGCSVITFCFAISVFFSKANTAATMAGFAYFISYAPYMFMQNNYDTLSLITKLISSLASNTAMGFGFKIILMYEGTGDGIQFSNIFTPNTPDDNLSLGLVMIMLAIDAIMYLIIALYVEAVFPGEYGVPQKWYYPFTSTYWCGKVVLNDDEKYDAPTENLGEFFENEPQQLNLGIKVKNLKKVFGKKTAVNGLSMNIYEDQITVLLGHNGAGKSTTMSMLTGMITPSNGLALINGYDIRKNMNEIRQSLGLCPQHNIIFDNLTVSEHLYFFSRLKGMKGKEIDAEIKKYVDLLELGPKKNTKSNELSGGMKRKLSVGIALCGNSKIVMLDEPTAGMDPSARRALWDLMLKQKTGRTVLLTTHFMDEADLLGDRIAIMAGGELKCCGSSFFLKKKYGAGYHLILDKSPACDPVKVTNLLRKYITTIEVQSNAGSELKYLLSEQESYVFESMLKDLEDHSSDLGINSYGVSLTTLEEVFMKVGADHQQEERSNGKANYKQIEENSHETSVQVNLAPRSTSSCEFIKNQIWAMGSKRVLSTWRSWILYLVHCFLPIVFITVSMLVYKQMMSTPELPAMPLDLSSFQNPVTLVHFYEKSDYSEKLKSYIPDSYKETNPESIENVTYDLTGRIPSTFRRRYIAGVMFDSIEEGSLYDGNMTAYFNNDPYHSPGVALGLALNAMYRKFVNNDQCSIDFINYPMPYTTESRINQIDIGFSTAFQVAFNLTFAMAFVSAYYVLFIVKERVSKSKHLQFVSGAKVPIFWLVTFIWDLMTFVVIACAALVSLVCFQEDGFKSVDDIALLFLLLINFGWSMLPLIYMAGYYYDVAASGYTKLIFLNIATGCVAFVIIQVLQIPMLNLEHIGDALHWVFLAAPHYSLATGIRDINKMYSNNSLCSERMTSCPGLYENFYKWESPGIGRNLLYSFMVGLVFLILLLLTEYELFSKVAYFIQQKLFPKRNVEVYDEDSDVQAEKHKIRNTPERQLHQTYNIVVKDLTKYYKRHLVVNGLCLGIKNAECFGLLGINGAGKTSTFKMLTGDIRISFGDSWLKGKSIKHDLKKVQKSIGYCPQFDALLEDLTARETLRMFALLRGISSDQCDHDVMKLADDFDFKQHLDKKVKELSGGNKRKLSTSIALIGDPPVVYLDEPTTGMDPATKRYLFNALCKIRDSGKTIVLTSHSMEECEALCTRLAVMVNGNFKCLGSTQHLKNKFAEGYTLTVKIKKPKDSSARMHASTEPIKLFIKENFPSSVLREEYEEMLTYYVTEKNVAWSTMFGILERGKNSDLNIEDYSLSQSSLEQVFLTFTRHQNEV